MDRLKKKSVRMWVLTCAIFLSFLFIFSGCKKDEPEDDSKAYYTNGEGEVGQNGGRIFLYDSLSLLNNATIDIYPYALSDRVYFTMTQPDSNYFLNGSKDHLMLEIKPAGTEFNFSVPLGIPYQHDPSYYFQVAYLYHPEEGILEELLNQYQDAENHLLFAFTNQTGIFFVDKQKMSLYAGIVTINLNGTERLAGYLPIGADFSEIPTNKTFYEQGFTDARSILYSDHVQGTASNFKAYLYRKDNPDLLGYKELEVRIIQGSSTDDPVEIVVDSISQFNHYTIYSRTNLEKEKAIDEWMSGLPLLFIFDEYFPVKSPMHEYYVKVLWALEKDHVAFTDRFYMQEWPVDMYHMTETAGDMNSNNILDLYEDIELGQPCPGIPSFEYQGKTYQTVQIGNQCWMKENLNYEIGNSWCYDNIASGCEHYGRLYDWETVMNGEQSSNSVPSGVRGICPAGWHVPSDQEWQILEGAVDSWYWIGDPVWSSLGPRGHDAGQHLKTNVGWEYNNGLDTYGFSALPGGYRDVSGACFWGGSSGLFWTSAASAASQAWSRTLVDDYKSVTRHSSEKTLGFSLRCLKD